VADGPRPNRPGEAELCAAVRSLVERGIDWPCELIRDYAPVNLGLARRVATGLDKVFSQVEQAIVLEDDCVAHPDFFTFCTEALERYRTQPDVWHISGDNFQAAPRPGSCYFSRYNHVWGWATWKRAWSRFDWEMSGWKSVRETNWLRECLGDPAATRYWRDGFDSVVEGRTNSWAYRWTYTIWRQGGLTLLPGVNLVQNVGFGPDGTNVRPADRRLSRPAGALGLPVDYPATIQRNEAADQYTERTLFSGGRLGRFRRMASRLRRWLNS